MVGEIVGVPKRDERPEFIIKWRFDRCLPNVRRKPFKIEFKNESAGKRTGQTGEFTKPVTDT